MPDVVLTHCTIFERAVVFEIADRRSAGRDARCDPRAGGRRHVFEAAATDVPVEQPRLAVLDLRTALDFRVDVAVDQEEIAPAVVIHVEEVGTPTDVRHVQAEA